MQGERYRIINTKNCASLPPPPAFLCFFRNSKSELWCVAQPRRGTWWTTWTGGSRLRAGRGGQRGCAPCRRGWRRWRCGRSCWTARSTTSARRPWSTAPPRRRPRAPSPASSPGAPRNEAAGAPAARCPGVCGGPSFWLFISGRSALLGRSLVTLLFGLFSKCVLLGFVHKSGEKRRGY